ncbi:ABC transporter ATP-binding protein [Rhodobaculum claviforme]|uniref:Oligopeptide ABC transporter ATP-binding protein n=1 Tax=Rhodobaculum claviforme TaxID=1549854 RepID=A0A934THF1_9RHOB|nr:oligopeptide/dipeptide ABC transporter ATP-binding protein [Rhodobaculum claviforme]MBK5926359.1 oligopeptide ABC transporter ATP-binding protein [Rhodobaculum claviforme]
MTDIILEARDLHRRFVTGGGLLQRATTIHAVGGVSLRIRRGETFAIVGESGCGKSTLARLLLRLIEPSSGSVHYDGRDLTALPPRDMRALRAQMQFIFQDPFSSLNPRMTVDRIVGEPLRLHLGLSGAALRARVAGLLTRVGLRPEHADRYPHEFSGGQRQRICIARALASGPKLLVGDEPVSALDVSVQAQIVNLLEDLKADLGLTLVVIAHDLAVIRHMADRVAVMYLGEIVEMAATEDLFTAPRHPYTRALLRAIPIPAPGGRMSGPAPGGRMADAGGAEPAGAVLGGDIPSPAAPPPGCRFHTRCAHATALCATTPPPLAEVTPGTQVACHHWAALPPAADAALRVPARSPAAEARFALYRAASERSRTTTHRETAP